METWSDYRHSEAEREFRAATDMGVISEVDYANKRIRISADGINQSDWLAWPAEVGRNYVRWRPLRVGQGVIVMALNGDPTQMQVVGMLFTDAIPSPSDDPDIDLVQFENGNLIEHNMSTGKFRIVGDIELTGGLTATGDVVAGDISLKKHRTSGVITGSAVSDVPVP